MRFVFENKGRWFLFDENEQLDDGFEIVYFHDKSKVLRKTYFQDSVICFIMDKIGRAHV